MIRNKGFQLLALAFVLTLLFSVSVLAGEEETRGAEGVAQSTVESTVESAEQAGDVTTTVEAYSYYPVYYRAFEHVFERTVTVFYEEDVIVRIPVYLEIEYSYSEGNWYEVYFANVTVYRDRITANGKPIKSENPDEDVCISTSSGCRRRIWIGVGTLRPCYDIYIRCDEWGWDYDIEEA